MNGILELTASGLYCSYGDFYIDPLRPVKRSVITHAHADHARWGCQSYLCAQDSKDCGPDWAERPISKPLAAVRSYRSTPSKFPFPGPVHSVCFRVDAYSGQPPPSIRGSGIWPRPSPCCSPAPQQPAVAPYTSGLSGSFCRCGRWYRKASAAKS